MLKSTLPKQAGQLNYSYDLNQRQLSITHPNFKHIIPQGGFDQVGNLLKDQIEDAEGTMSRSFAYDNLYQLTSEKGLHEHCYAYDSINNRIMLNELSCSIDSFNQLQEQDGIFYTHDLNGNRVKKMEQGKITHYSYDALNRMTSCRTSERFIHYVYDAFDRRILKGDECFLYDGQNEIGMFKDGKLEQLRILKDSENSEHGSAIAIMLKSDHLIPLHDIFGNVSSLLTLEGKTKKTYRYSAFGNELIPTNLDSNPWRFASKRLDPETGFIYFGRRYYDPQTARWTSPDPAEFADGLNLHAYLLNNPLNQLDAYGLWSEDFWECGSSFAKGGFNRAWEFGTGFYESAGYMGSWLNADLDYEYCGDCTTFNEKMTQSWKTLQDYSTAFAEAPMSSLGSLLAPGVMKAYHLDSNASLSEQWSAYGEATTDLFLLGSPGILKGTSAALGVLKKTAFKAGTASKFSNSIERVQCNPLANTVYTQKVIKDMKLNAKTASPDFHGFPRIVDNYAKFGSSELLIGRDGIKRTKVTISGGYQGKDGYFEWIIESDKTVNHRLFVPKKM